MASDKTIEQRIKIILKQAAGSVKPSDGELIPEVSIRGVGHIFCYSPSKKSYVNVTRGLKAYIIDEELYKKGNILIYTFTAQLVEIDPDELIYTGFD